MAVDPVKRDELGKQYNIQRTYSYEQYEECLNSGKVDAPFIVIAISDAIALSPLAEAIAAVFCS